VKHEQNNDNGKDRLTRQTLVQTPNTKYHRNPSSSCRDEHVDGQTGTMSPVSIRYKGGKKNSIVPDINRTPVV